MFDSFSFSFTDSVIKDQVWKENIDLQVFEKLMEQCNIFNSEQKMRYIKFISEESDENASTKNLIDDVASTETEKAATGGNTELPAADQMFLETTV